MAIFVANDDKDIQKLLELTQDDDNETINNYNSIRTSSDSNIHLKDVLKQYKKYFELKLNEKKSQEKALLVIIHYLDNILDTNNYNQEQYSHIDKQKDDIFRELLTIQDTINKYSRLK
tara:strand:+ start:298 stop:651 length:354 start_codon:yes stop_codon:yes gene_type:complete